MSTVSDSSSSNSSNSSSNGNNGRSRDRSVCVVPSPLAAATVEDVAGNGGNVSVKEQQRRDFSRLFVPIPPSPGNMEYCSTDMTEEGAVIMGHEADQENAMSVDSSQS